MKLLPTKTPEILKKITPAWIWSIETTAKKIYLTFDDGPIPEATPFVLKTLEHYQAKATFFCIGANIIKHPELLEDCITKGHAIGNHTYHHLNGWKTTTQHYLENTLKTTAVLEHRDPHYKKNLLFRPPYGKITPQQSKALRALGYKIIMWDILPRDWEKKYSSEHCLEKVLHHTKPGSIIVLHDSIKAFTKMSYTLPKILSYYTAHGFTFESLNHCTH